MKATVVKRGTEGNYSAHTSNDIGISFSIRDGTVLNLGDELEIDLFDVTRTKTVIRLNDQRVIAVGVSRERLTRPSPPACSRRLAGTESREA